jgi:hypothetical protein
MTRSPVFFGRARPTDSLNGGWSLPFELSAFSEFKTLVYNFLV